MATQKTERINLRASVRQETILRQAAASTDSTMSDFILGSAVENAEKILADRRWFVASEKDFAEFERLLDTPIPTEKLTSLLQEESPFEQEIEID